MHVLIITREYPPSVSGGARRPHAIAVGLKSHGLKVTVASPYASPPDLRLDHFSIVDEQPTKRSRWSPLSPLRLAFYSVTRWPDPDIKWIKTHFGTLIAEAADRSFDAILTTSPPESIHAAAWTLKSQNPNLIWIADLRDSWLRNPLRRDRFFIHRRLGERQMANRWLSRADIICAPLGELLNEACDYAPYARRVILPQATGTTKGEILTPPEKFWPYDTSKDCVLVHLGGFTKSDFRRSIEPLLRAFCSARIKAPNLRLALYGNLSASEQALAQKIEGCDTFGILPKRFGRAVMLKANALVLANAQGVTSVPGKLSEYLTVDRPIVFVGTIPQAVQHQVGPMLTPVDQMIDIANGSPGIRLTRGPSPAVAVSELVSLLTK